MIAATIASALIVVAVAVVGAGYAMRRADKAAKTAGKAVWSAKRAWTSAEAARHAAVLAQRHCDDLAELLAEMSPTARRVRLAAIHYGSPRLALQHGRRIGDRIDEGTT